jgi:hypothetical protein
MLYARQLKVKPANEKLAADEADEGEDADTADNEQDVPAPIIVGSQPRTTVASVPQPEPNKMIQTTAQSMPSFAPVVIEFDKSGAERPEKKERPRIVKNK